MKDFISIPNIIRDRNTFTKLFIPKLLSCLLQHLFNAFKKHKKIKNLSMLYSTDR